MKKLFTVFALVWAFGLCALGQPILPSTAYTRDLLRSVDAAEARTKLAIQGVASIKDYGALGNNIADDWSAFNTWNASTNKTIIIPAGNYKIGADITFASDKLMIFEAGGVLYPAVAQTVIIKGTIQAPDITLFAGSGTVKFATTYPYQNQIVNVCWFGANPENGADSKAAIQHAVDAVQSGVGQEVYIPPGVYNVASSITLTPNRLILRGAGKNKTQINFAPTSASPLFIVTTGDNYILRDLLLLNSKTSGSILTTAFETQPGGSSSTVLTFDDITFSKFTAYALNLTNTWDVNIHRCLFGDISNITGQGGTGSGVAIAIRTVTTCNALNITETRFSKCDQVLYHPYGATINFIGCNLEADGYNGISPTDIVDVGATRVDAFNVIGCYIEGERTGANAIFKITNGRGVNIQGCNFAGDFGGTTYTTNFIHLADATTGATIQNNIFSHVGTGGLFVKTSGTGTGRLTQNAFTLDGTTLLTTWAAIDPYVGAVDMFLGSSSGTLDNVVGGTVRYSIDASGNIVDYGMLQLAGTSSSYPALKRNGILTNFRLADDSAYAPIAASYGRFNNNSDGSTTKIYNVMFERGV